MSLANHHLTLTQAKTADEEAQACCQLAVKAEEKGDYLGALQALRPFCEGVGVEPSLDGLNDLSKAKLLLRAGVLTSRIGTNKGLKESQESAKNLLCLSVDYFERAGERDGIAEANIYLAVCYFMLGETEEARIVLHRAFSFISEQGVETRVKANIWLAIIEYGARRFVEALRIHQQTQTLLSNVESHYLLGTFHSEHANTLEALGRAEDNPEYLDRALMEFTAAAYHLELAGHESYCARITNNHGFLLHGLHRYEEALAQFEKSRCIFDKLGDSALVARIDVNRARSFCELGKYFEALKIIKRAVDVLESGEQAERLVEALTVQATVLARVGNNKQTRGVYMRAVLAANNAGNREAAGVAYLSMLEEVADLTDDEASSSYQEARALLDKVQDGSITRRLLAASGSLVAKLSKKARPQSDPDASEWEGFSFARAKKEFEKEWVVKAMRAAGGTPAVAARLLGMEKPQRIYQLLKEHGIPYKNNNHSIMRTEERSNVSDLYDYIEFVLPEGVTEDDVCAVHKVTTNVLEPFGAAPGDYALIMVCEVKDGELAGVDVYGQPYRIGVLATEGERVRLTSKEGVELLPLTPRTALEVEGKVVGYLKAEDVAAYRKGRRVKSYSI